MRIKKISPTTPANGNIENQYGTSQTNAYSEAYINSAIPTKTSQLTNDSNFATKDVATTSANGLMSASDKNMLEKAFMLKPIFPNHMGDNGTETITPLSTLLGGYIFINTHINLREIYMITYADGIGMRVDTIYQTATGIRKTNFSFSNGVITITGGENCRGQLYQFELKKA